jgi:hypothetical protein
MCAPVGHEYGAARSVSETSGQHAIVFFGEGCPATVPKQRCANSLRGTQRFGSGGTIEDGLAVSTKPMLPARLKISLPGQTVEYLSRHRSGILPQDLA